MTPTKQPTPRVRLDVAESVVQWRLETLERAGYDHEQAERLARSDADLHRRSASSARAARPSWRSQS
jgi:hypothetical protein